MTLTSGELADIRTDFEAQILDSTCTILRPSRTADGAGGFTETEGTVAADVACRIGRARQRGAAGESAMQTVYPDGYILDVEHDQDVQEGDRIVSNSTTYEVVHVEDGAVQWMFLKSAHVRVRNG